MLLCDYDGIFRSKEDGPVHIGGERRVVDVTFDVF